MICDSSVRLRIYKMGYVPTRLCASDDLKWSVDTQPHPYERLINCRFMQLKMTWYPPQFNQLILIFYDSVMILNTGLILSIKFSPNITRSLFQSQEIAVTVETTSARNAVSNTVVIRPMWLSNLRIS